MKVAVITGAAQGIGRRTAEILGEHGFAQALIDLREPSETLAALKSRNVDVLSFAGDITSEDVVSEFAGDVESRWGRADVLVNNAGISLIAPSETIAAKDYRRVLEVNLVAPFLLAQALGRKMLAAGQGSIINIASVAGLLGIADRAAYNASKHGLIGLTRTLAAEWATRGVRVNAIAPGFFMTALNRDKMDPERKSSALRRTPMGRFGELEELVNAALYFASPGASFVTGEVLSVDGGYTAAGL